MRGLAGIDPFLIAAGRKAEMLQWKRSVFNSLAEIVVQSTKSPGDIKLTVHTDGLSLATLVINSQICTPCPCVP